MTEAMYCVSIMYPANAGSSFNLKHYLDAHMPLGIGLFHRESGLVPYRIEVLAPEAGAEAPYHCICNLYFCTEADLERFRALLSNEEAARLLQADFPNYTTAMPVAVFSRRIELDPARLAAGGPRAIEAAQGAIGKG